MPETAVYAPGTPIWVDIASPELEATKAFYKAIFGWESSDVPEVDAGGYGMFTKNGRIVAGYGRRQNEQQPVAWSTYVLVDDAQQTAEKVTAAGGAVLMEPMQVMDAGSMAVVADPTGAVISVWQAGRHRGAEVFNVPGSLTWNELRTRDPGVAVEFYAKTFGWGAGADPANASYTEWKLDDRSIGGMMPMGEAFPAQVPAHWIAYFGVENVDASLTAIEAAGGTVMMPAMDIAQGRIAGVSDPHGAMFALFEVKGG